MKKILTVNGLAIGNLKARKKQYITMIIGIVLAMVLSSSIVFFLFSSAETNKAQRDRDMGYQNAIVAAENFTEKDYKKLVNKGYFSEYAFAHNIGYAYTNDEKNTRGICWLEDDAKKLSNQIFLEGRYPTAEDEIAIERAQLLSFGLPKAKLGDKIKLNIKIQNGVSEPEKSTSKEYTLVGIVSDKASNIEANYGTDQLSVVPGIFVAQGTPVYDGGRELLISYVKFNFDELKAITKKMQKEHPEEYYDYSSLVYDYLEEETGGKYLFNGANLYMPGLSSLDDLFPGGDIMGLVMLVMIFAACISIINAFNTNLKDRKQQIGMMRAVGTTRRQIMTIYGREAFIISLIATPISILISYLLVMLALKVISDDAVMSKSILSLPIAAAVNIIVVMLAAYIPLKTASRITPMQAIRNIKNNRKTKSKKIKTKKRFDTAKLWAKRSLTFYKGGHIAVSIILCATIITSCISASAMSYEKNNLDSLPYDYTFNDYNSNGGGWYNSASNKYGFTQSEYQQIYSKPYVSEMHGTKTAMVNMAIDEYNDLMYAQRADEIVYNQMVSEGKDGGPKSVDEFQKFYKKAVKNKTLSDPNSDGNDYYAQQKKELQISDDKEVYTLTLDAHEDKLLQDLEDYVLDGKIDYNKLSSGKEVILVAPQNLEVRMKFYRNGGYGTMTAMDDELSKRSPGYKTVISAKSPYKAGDTLELIVADADTEYHEDEESDYTTYNVKNVKKHTVKIGAIISPQAVRDERRLLSLITKGDIALLTNMQGINKIHPGSVYSNLYINTSVELDDEKDLEIKEDLECFKGGNTGGRYLESNYGYISNQKSSARMLFAAMICITIIGFAICASIINNSITSKIRENKKVIGMLRTVGAGTGALVKSFIIQMLSMFGWGIGTGYGLYLLLMLLNGIAKKIFSESWYIDLNFSPWFSLIMTVLMFAICFVNLYSKIKKEMKNSIIDNIREL